MLNQISNGIISMDYMGVKPLLNYKEKANHKSLFGGLLSILSFLISLSFIIIYTCILINRSNFTLYQSDHQKVIPFRKWENNLSLLLLDRYFNPFEDSDRLFWIYADMWIDKTNRWPNGTSTFKTINESIKLEKCNIKHWDNYPLWMNEKYINSSICLSPSNNLNLTNSYGAQGYTGIVFWVKFCQNTTDNKHNCYPKEEIKRRLDNVFLHFKFLNYYFDHDSPLNYIIPFVHTKVIQASSSIYKRQWYLFKNIEYFSDEGFLFNHYNMTEVSILSSEYHANDLRSEPTIKDAFLAVSLNMVETKGEIRRTYFKLQDLFAHLGGIITCILFIGKSLNYIQSNILYHQSIINSNINHYMTKAETASFLKQRPTLPRNSLTQYYPTQALNKSSQLNMLKLDNNNTINSPKRKDTKYRAVTKPININKTFKESFNEIENMTAFRTSKIFINCPKKLRKPAYEIHLNFFDYINPIYFLCPSMFNSKPQSHRGLYSKLRCIIIKQLDIINIVTSLNNFEKIEHFLLGKNNIQLLNSCVNALRIQSHASSLIPTIMTTNTEIDLPDECNLLDKRITELLTNKLSRHHLVI